MSPEQASPTPRLLDGRTDVYSLGASLYELATGKPVFTANTIEALLSQIALDEPVPPRVHRRDLPRDLETVLLKCLAKDPARRYATARELADDLRRVVNGEPVKARRPNVLLRLGRWAGKQSRGSKVAAVAVLATLLLLAGLLLGWEALREPNQGQLQIASDRSGVRAEILTRDGEPVLPPITLPTADPVSLREGWYLVRVSVIGVLSTTYEVLVTRGQLQSVTLPLGQRELSPPLPLTGGGEIVTLGKRAKVLLHEGGLRLVNLETHQTDWPQQAPLPFARGGSISPLSWELPGGLQLPGLRVPDWVGAKRSALVQPAPDLDGDGVSDLLWAKPGAMQLGPAVSGRDGRVLWTIRQHSLRTETQNGGGVDAHRVIVAGFEGPLAAAQAITKAFPPVMAKLACKPILTDIDEDGRLDVIAVFATIEDRNESVRLDKGIQKEEDIINSRAELPPDHLSPQDGSWQGYLRRVRTWVIAVRGTTGEQRWCYEIPEREELGWQHHLSPFWRDGHADKRPLPADLDEEYEPEFKWSDWGPHFAAFLTRAGGHSTLTVRADRQIVRLDVRTGRPVGVGDVVRLGVAGDWQLSPDGQRLLIQRDHHYSCRSTADLSSLWPPDIDAEAAHWHIVCHPKFDAEWRKLRGARFVGPDLLFDGKQVSDHFDVACLEINSGKELWHTSFASEKNVIAFDTAFVPGLGDDTGCYLTAALISGDAYGYAADHVFLMIAANARDDGRFLWRRFQRCYGKAPQIREIWGKRATVVRWLPTAPRRWPYLAITYHNDTQQSEPACSVTYLYHAGGQLLHVWPEVEALAMADFSQDPTPQLYGLRKTSAGQREGQYSLHFARLGRRELWRRPGWWSTGVVRSDGGALPPGPEGDLDGDGVPDVFLFSTERDAGGQSYLQAVSGKDGHRLWRSDVAGGGGSVACVDLAADGQHDVIWEAGGNEGEIHLLNGRTGRARWTARIADESRSSCQSILGALPWSPRAVVPGIFAVDVDGDGFRDVVVMGAGKISCHVFNGRNGHILKGPFPAAPDWQGMQPRAAPEGLERFYDGAALSFISWKDKDGHEVWRCNAPEGHILTGAQPPAGPGKPPRAFAVRKVEAATDPVYTICLEAEPVGADIASQDFDSVGEDRILAPLPWAVAGAERVMRSAWFALIGRGLVFFFAFRRPLAGLSLLVWLSCFPVIVGAHLIKPSWVPAWWVVVSPFVIVLGPLGLAVWGILLRQDPRPTWFLSKLPILVFGGVTAVMAGVLCLGAAAAVLAGEPFDWSGWYLLWPYSFASLSGWYLLANPLTWVAPWVAWRAAVALRTRWVQQAAKAAA
jgi:hypothetical protein